MIQYNNIRSGKNCVIWTRVSTKYQEDNGGSLASQKEVCEAYAKQNSYKIVGYCGGKHESAKTPGAMITEMYKRVKRDKTISTILVSEFDRFSRTSWQATKMLEELRLLGVVVIATKYGLETRTKEGMMMAQNTLSMAQWDNQNRTDKFVSGRADCLKNGAWCEKAPLGYYKKGKSRDTWCYPNETGKLLKLAFKWKLEFASNSEILHRLALNGLNISKQTLHKVLVNPFYAGKITHKLINNEMVDGHIEPIISYKEFLKVQEILSGRTGKYTQAKHNERCPLTKYVFCSEDGTPFTSYTKTKKLKTFDYYKCNKRGCKTNVSAKEMHGKYEELLTNFSLPETVLSNFKDLIREAFESINRDKQEELTVVKRNLAIVEESLKKAKIRHVCGEVSDEDYSEVVADLNAKKDELLLKIEKLDFNLSNLEKSIPVIIATASKLGDLWVGADYEGKVKIERLVYPDGIFWDKENRNYRTENRNVVFDVMDRFSGISYKSVLVNLRKGFTFTL